MVSPRQGRYETLDKARGIGPGGCGSGTESALRDRDKGGNKDGGKGGGNGSRPARLIDVARRAKVSRATAARALGGYGLVGEETRRRVAQAARELNYSTNELARAMRAGRSQTIGVVVADISNSFFSAAARAIIDTAGQAGYQVLVLNTDDDLEKERDAVRVLLEKRVDGLIVSPASPKDFAHLAPEGKPARPLVLLDRRLAGLAAPTVITGDHVGARQAVAHLLAHGHRQIGVLVATAAAGLTDPAQQPAGIVSTVADRVAGARAALASPHIHIRYSRSDIAAARGAALALLSQDTRPTALLATNEEMTLGVLAACAELGLRIGLDISLIGFDDAPWFNVLSPAISAIRRPTYDMGEVAVTRLLAAIRGDGRTPLIELPTELIERQSVTRLLPDRVDDA